MKELSGRLAVITGAGSGIGRALAIACAAGGMRTLLADVDEAGLDATTSLLPRDDTLTLRVDVSRADQVAALADLAFGAADDVALLFNNAGVASGGWIWESTPQDWQWLIGVNLMGVVHGIQSFVPRMLRQQRPAHVVNTASAAGLISVPAGAAYCASKHAVVTLSECLHHELKLNRARIGVSVLCPSFVPTGIADSERHRPAELRGAVDEPAARDARLVQAMQGAPLSADQVAELTLEAVGEGRFYVLPHGGVRRGVAQRLSAIVDGNEPPLGWLPGTRP
jgi:NAD(P)-dependent dehydrogenase (short-subunit alcohol dehydrogenase family)